MLDSNMEMLRSLAKNVIDRGGSQAAASICQQTLDMLDEADRASEVAGTAAPVEEQPIPEILE